MDRTHDLAGREKNGTNWPAAKLKYVARFAYGDSLSSTEGEGGPIPVFGSNGAFASTAEPNTLSPVIVVGRKGSYGKVNWSSRPVFASDTTFFIDRTTTTHDLRWLFWTLQTLGLDTTSDDAAVPGLNRENAYSQPVALPPLETQRAIADFLDAETSRIDALIAAKANLLAILAEKRRALVTQSVTSGLDPSVPMRDSGIPWLGETPAHWEVTRVRRVATVGQGDAFAHAIQGQTSGDFPWFKVQDMNRPGNEIEMVTADNYIATDVARDARANVFPPGATVFPRVGAALLTNKRRLLVRPSIVDDNTYAVVPNESIRSRFLYRYFELVDMARICSTGLVPTVTFSAIKSLPILLPPLDEQDQIVDYIAHEHAAADALSARTADTIKLLRERREAVIAAAVTGQLEPDAS